MTQKTRNGFFTESNGERSMMRLLSFILVASGVLIVGAAVMFGLNGGHYGLELAILGIFGKGYQKRIETKPEKHDVEKRAEQGKQTEIN